MLPVCYLIPTPSLSSLPFFSLLPVLHVPPLPSPFVKPACSSSFTVLPPHPYLLPFTSLPFFVVIFPFSLLPSPTLSSLSLPRSLSLQEIVVTQEEDTQATASAEVADLESRISELVATIKTIEQHKAR